MTAAIALDFQCLSLVCAVGLTPASAAAAMRAGISGIANLPYAIRHDEPLTGAPAPLPGPATRGRGRLVALLQAACHDIADKLPDGLKLPDLPLLLCTRPADEPGPTLHGIVAEIENNLGLRFARQEAIHVAQGAVSAFSAIAQARQLIASGRAQACLVAAVDSLLDARILARLARQDRLQHSRQSDGLIPGEAACVALLTRPREDAGHAARPSLRIHGLGFAQEEATPLNNAPLLGWGMTRACVAALDEASLEMPEVDFRLSDAAGEAYAFEELVLAQTRLMRRTRATQDLWHPASAIGDCGAASGLVQLAWAEQAFMRGYAPGPIAMAHTGHVQGRRATALIRATRDMRHAT
jgi:3-oxoacyl-[acyl-carrier-protein] synthase-1